MATITAVERQRLGNVRPELWAALLGLNDAANSQLGLRLAVAEDGGTRSSVTQAALYADSLAQGGGVLAYAVGKPGTSRHEFGAAFDVHIVGGGSDDDYRALADIGEQLGLTAGYYFAERGVGLKDEYHFQLAETLNDSRARWAAMQQAGLFKAVALAVLAVLIIGAVRS